MREAVKRLAGVPPEPMRRESVVLNFPGIFLLERVYFDLDAICDSRRCHERIPFVPAHRQDAETFVEDTLPNGLPD